MYRVILELSKKSLEANNTLDIIYGCCFELLKIEYKV